MLVAARIRAQLQYRASFAADLFGQAMLVPLEFVEVYVLLHAAPVFGALTLAQATLVYGLASFAFGIADMVVGQLDQVNQLIKDGSLGVLLTRPTSLLVQLATQDVQLRRLGRSGVGLGLYLWALWYCQVPLTSHNVALAVLAPLGGVAIFSALFVIAAGVLFFLLDANQAVNMVTYGGRYAASVPGSALMPVVRGFYTFVIPATLVAYVPACVLTGAPLPGYWWPGLAWLGLPVGLGLWALGLGWWRIAVRHYTGAGG